MELEPNNVNVSPDNVLPEKEDPTKEMLEQAGAVQIENSKVKPLTDYEYDISATRIHFSTFGDSAGRTLIIFSQLLAIASLFLPLGSLSAVLVQLLPFSSDLDSWAPFLWKLITIIFTMFGVLTTLLFLIPTILVKNIRGLTIWATFFLTFGTFVSAILFGANLLNYFYSDIPGSIVGVITSAIGAIMFITGSITLLSTAKKYREHLEVTMSESIRKTNMQSSI